MDYSSLISLKLLVIENKYFSLVWSVLERQSFMILVFLLLLSGKTQMLPAGCEPLKSQADSGQILLPERAEQLYCHTTNIQLKIKHVDFIIVQVHGWLAGEGEMDRGKGEKLISQKHSALLILKM